MAQKQKTCWWAKPENLFERLPPRRDGRDRSICQRKHRGALPLCCGLCIQRYAKTYIYIRRGYIMLAWHHMCFTQKTYIFIRRGLSGAKTHEQRHTFNPIVARAMEIIELHCTDLRWFGFNWSLLSWIETRWIELDRRGMKWIVLRCVKLKRIDLKWNGLSWTELNWAEWNGLNTSNGWNKMNWAELN